MDVLPLLVTLILIGVGLYVVNAIIPMDEKIKTIINVVVVILVLLWLVNVFTGYWPNTRIGPHR